MIIYDIKASEFIDFGVNVGVTVSHQGLSTHDECHKVKINVFDYGHHCPGHVRSLLIHRIHQFDDSTLTTGPV